MRKKGKSWSKKGERGREGGGKAGRAVNQNTTAKSSTLGPSTSAFHRLFPPLQHSYVSMPRGHEGHHTVYSLQITTDLLESMCTQTFCMLSGSTATTLCSSGQQSCTSPLRAASEAWCLHKDISGMNNKWKFSGGSLSDWLSSFYNYSRGRLFCVKVISIVYIRSFSLTCVNMEDEVFTSYLKKD